MKVKFLRLNKTAIIPSYAKPGDAGLDITATRVIELTKTQVTYGTDLAVEIPAEHVGLLFPRSSIRKTNLSLSNSVGMIDSGYRGEIMATFNISSLNKLYEPGERIAQLLIIPFPEIEPEEATELSVTARGENGFGSTGN